MSADSFMLWNIIGSIIVVLIFIHILVKRAEQEERERNELEKRRKAKFEEKYLKERKELRELLLGLSINESQVIRELMLNSGSNRRLVYDNLWLGISMFEVHTSGEIFYVIYDSKHRCWYHNWHAYTSNDDSNIIRIVEYHRNLRK